MQKHEYKVLGTGIWNIPVDSLEKKLNGYGIDGWKVVATIESDGYTEKLILVKES
jgi:hypothetical protein